MVIEHKYDLAKDVFTKLLNLCPDDVEIMALHANIYLVEGRLIEAENRLNQVIALNPNYPMALYFLGVVYHEKGEYEKAIHMYETALKYFSEYNKEEIADVYQNLGCSLWEIKRREQAIEAWKTCLKYNPRQRYAKENIEQCTNEHGMEKSEVGMDDFWAFVEFKREEYLSVKGKDSFDDSDEINYALEKIMDAWNTEIIDKYGRKLDGIKTKEKVKLFKDTKCV
ncbi:MAG: tetratricopeptide repeat protein [Candidatus Methanoperedens sp.]|nr:tetratricopeptide repeat protein [Candidatus Methanoperedens sp.]